MRKLRSALSSTRQLSLALLSVSVLTLSGCDRSVSVAVDASADEAGHVAASTQTKAYNNALADTLPLADQEDFEQARRGLIASMDSLKIMTDKGQVAWNQDAYDFVAGEAPDSVNPSLWRQAKLNGIHGLFKVTDGIYQLRGFDLANLTLIESDNGWILVDPLTLEDNARVAMAFAREHLGDKPVKAVLFTHSHIDHFGGVKGALRESDYEGLEIIAPAGFVDESVSENIMAGVAMQRRATFMYGRNLPVSPRGHVDTGLGKEPAKDGLVAILEPTHEVKQTGESLTIDGVEFVFQVASGSEAPAEFTFYLPEHNAFGGAEVVSRTMHNVYTLRGAKVRDALVWSHVIDEALTLFGAKSDVYFGSHHWPIWGQDKVTEFLKQQRDTYKFIHDQTLRMANKGFTPREIAETLELPSTLSNNFSNRGYYGTVSHNAKAVYQHYFGWYDANPANLNPHTPSESAKRYVEFIGGAELLLNKAQASYAEGDYRWVAEVVNHLVFAEPDNAQARGLLAKAYDQLAYQAESGPWRDVYLSAAYELRHGAPQKGMDLSDSAGMLLEVETSMFFASMAARLDADKAEGEQYVLNVHMTDSDEQFVLSLSNSVLHHRLSAPDPAADASLTLTRELFLNMMIGEAGIKDTLFSDNLKVEGSILSLLGFLSMFEGAVANFNVVTP